MHIFLVIIAHATDGCYAGRASPALNLNNTSATCGQAPKSTPQPQTRPCRLRGGLKALPSADADSPPALAAQAAHGKDPRGEFL
jgi:hypothetical protein